MKHYRKPKSVINAIQWFFPKLEKIVPNVAHKLYYKSLNTPYKCREDLLSNQLEYEVDIHHFFYNSKKISYYKWGKIGGKKILFVHGWAGNATHSLPIKNQFIKEGYEFIALDLPAHGNSSGKNTNLRECAEIVNRVAEKLGTVDLVIGHSFGGAVVALARNLKQIIKRHIAISTPHDLEYVLSIFSKTMNASPSANNYVKRQFSEKLNVCFDDVNPINMYGQFDEKSMLVIHDNNDKEVPIEISEKTLLLHPGFKFFRTNYLGHRRLLKNKEVHQICLSFMQDAGPNQTKHKSKKMEYQTLAV